MKKTIPLLVFVFVFSDNACLNNYFTGHKEQHVHLVNNPFP
ncbi:MAG: hypothetical protein ABIQ40_13975 [Bacteroidia bacterium]